MTKVSLPPELPGPRITLHTVLVDLLALLLGIIIFLFPPLSEDKYYEIRVVLSITIPAGIILIPLSWWLLRWGIVTLKRASRYTSVLKLARDSLNELDETKKEKFQLLLRIATDSLIEIERVQYNHNDLYIALNKNGIPQLPLDAVLQVVDINDGMPMGKFKVVEIRKDEYYAINDGIVDPLWLGYVREQGETTMPPHLRAIHLTAGARNE